MNACPEGTGRAASVQVVPPSEELAANGSTWPEVVRTVPTATTAGPSLATRCSTARRTPIGSGTATLVQAWPFGDTHADGWLPAQPTATKPRGLAVTASICAAAPSRAPGNASPARRQPVRPADHQAAAIGRPAEIW